MEKELWHCQNVIILKTRQIFFTAVVLEGISMRQGVLLNCLFTLQINRDKKVGTGP